jgi:hypothetical protein
MTGAFHAGRELGRRAKAADIYDPTTVGRQDRLLRARMQTYQTLGKLPEEIGTSPGFKARVAAVLRGAGEGIRGGASIVGSTFGTDALGITDSSQYRDRDYRFSRPLAWTGQALLAAAGAGSGVQAARAAIAGGARAIPAIGAGVRGMFFGAGGKGGVVPPIAAASRAVNAAPGAGYVSWIPGQAVAPSWVTGLSGLAARLTGKGLQALPGSAAAGRTVETVGNAVTGYGRVVEPAYWAWRGVQEGRRGLGSRFVEDGRFPGAEYAYDPGNIDAFPAARRPELTDYLHYGLPATMYAADRADKAVAGRVAELSDMRRKIMGVPPAAAGGK